MYNSFFHSSPQTTNSDSRRLLIVDFIEARDLLAPEKAAKSEPILHACLVNNMGKGGKISGEEFTTKKPNGNTLSPQYNESFSFGHHFDLSCEILPTLLINVYNKATDLKMGMIEIPLDTVGGKSDTWYPIQKASGMTKVSGQIHLQFSFKEPVSDIEGGIRSSFGDLQRLQQELRNEDPMFKEKPANELTVIVIQGRDLLACDNLPFQSGKSDPFVKLKVNDCKEQSTKIVYKSLTPKWNEKFVFENVIDIESTLVVVVEDYDQYLPMNDFMGKISIPLRPFADKIPRQQWYTLFNQKGETDSVNRGAVELLLQWKFNPKLLYPKTEGFLSSTFGQVYF